MRLRGIPPLEGGKCCRHEEAEETRADGRALRRGELEGESGQGLD